MSSRPNFAAGAADVSPFQLVGDAARGIVKRLAARQPWEAEELAWAQEAFRAGDTLAEIAEIAGRDLMDVARALGVDGPKPLSLRWRRSERGVPSPWIGRLLKEVAVARCEAGEEPEALASLAEVSRSQMFRLLKGAVKRRRRKRQQERAA